jgi:hypothetical protein
MGDRERGTEHKDELKSEKVVFNGRQRNVGRGSIFV